MCSLIGAGMVCVDDYGLPGNLPLSSPKCKRMALGDDFKVRLGDDWLGLYLNVTGDKLKLRRTAVLNAVYDIARDLGGVPAEYLSASTGCAYKEARANLSIMRG
ncbi:hypothetical protein CBOM_07051 [Ceraceosorus bombacis]|uniref:Uncharacterized protein n=1 Tax=Ceraceosorus bombacis TaxID=401625 RepID=A0A0P1BL24_9BASI|nr:hypothetical protein CBOM_07051 [Ceraceosorus bombacis]